MPDSRADRIRSTYDKVAAHYAESLPDNKYEPSIDIAIIRHFVARLDQVTSPHILDAGCGTGRMIAFLASLRTDAVVTGVDLSASMLHEARRAHPEALLIEGDLSGLPLPDACLDGILCWYSIIHTPPAGVPDILTEFHRVLRPGGYLLLGYQTGGGERILRRAYGHNVNLTAYLHETSQLESDSIAAGLDVHARFDRAPRTAERWAQGFLLVCRPACSATADEAKVLP